MSTIAVILGSTRPGRFSERPARWIASRLQQRAGVQVELLDLLEYPLPLFAEAKAPAFAPRQYASPDIERWGKKVDSADGFVWVTPEYNHGYSAVLKNAIDHLYVEWGHKPVAFVSSGGAGGSRAVEQLRQVAAALTMTTVAHAVHVMPDVMRAASGAADDAPFRPLEGTADRVIDELLWWVGKLRSAEPRG